MIIKYLNFTLILFSYNFKMGINTDLIIRESKYKYHHFHGSIVILFPFSKVSY